VSGNNEERHRLQRIDPVREAACLAEDAERYRQLALSLGATDALVIDTATIPVDDRVLLKCRVPLCSSYGICGNCPPHCPHPDEMRRFLAGFRTAVVFRSAVSSPAITAQEGHKEELKTLRRGLYGLTSALESAAFYDGHYFAAGFASGSCKTLYCRDQECAVVSGERCRQSLRARPAMEAVGIDCFALTARLGWVIYPIGKTASPDEIPSSFLMGVVLVG
jgi:predicted metal-binding protein